MASPPQKDWFDIAIDFFFGAVFVDFWIAAGFVKFARRGLDPSWHISILLICLFAGMAIGGSLAALSRNRFWSEYEKFSIIPPVEESLSQRSKTVLWIIFAAGCVTPLFLFVWH